MLVGAAAPALAGCVTTQQKAAWLRMNAARIRASQVATHVGARDPRIEVISTTLVHARGGTAVVVKLRNRAPAPVSDLPIVVGVTPRSPGRPQPRAVYLNAAANLDYFQNHLPALGAGEVLTWVFTTGRRLASTSRPFAVVGLPDLAALASPRALPALTARLTAGSPGRRSGELKLSVANLSSVPQYDEPVYAVASRRGRYVAAAETTIAELDAGATASLQLTLTGQASHAAVTVQTSPTIFG